MQGTMEVDKYEDKMYSRDAEYQHSWRITTNPQDAGGEAIWFIIDVFHNSDDGEEYTNVRIHTECYGASSTELNLSFDPYELATAILNLSR